MAHQWLAGVLRWGWSWEGRTEPPSVPASPGSSKASLSPLLLPCGDLAPKAQDSLIVGWRR